MDVVLVDIRKTPLVSYDFSVRVSHEVSTDQLSIERIWRILNRIKKLILEQLELGTSPSFQVFYLQPKENRSTALEDEGHQVLFSVPVTIPKMHVATAHVKDGLVPVIFLRLYTERDFLENKEILSEEW